MSSAALIASVLVSPLSRPDSQDMTRTAILIPLICFLSLTGQATAFPQRGEGPLTLDDCVAIALRENPVVHRSREDHRAALARVNQARALPQPVVSYDSDLQPKPFHFSRSGESYVGVSQTVEFPGKRTTRGRVAAAEADAVSADADVVRLDLAFSVRETFQRLLLAEERLKLAEEDRALAERFSAQTAEKLAAGDVGRVELLRAEVEAARAAAAVTAAQNEVALGRARLNHWLARPADSPISIQGRLGAPAVPRDSAPLKARAIEDRPEVRRVQFAVSRERLRRDQARLSYFPDVEVGFARHRIAGEATSWDVTLAVPVPLFFWQPRKGEMAEAEAGRAAAEREAERLQSQVLLEVEEAHRNALHAEEQIARLEREILPKAQESFEMFAFAYQEGEIEGLELIAARRTLLEARQAHVESLYNSSIAAAALARATGEPIPRS